MAAGFGAVSGKPFVAGDPPGVTYTAARCADFLEYAPGAHSCEQAATIHHFGEVVGYLLVAGVLGLFAILAYLWLRRRLRIGPPVLSERFEATIGVTLYGAAALALFAVSFDGIAIGQTAGVGAYLSGAIVSLVLAAFYGADLYRTLPRRLRATEPPMGGR